MRPLPLLLSHKMTTIAENRDLRPLSERLGYTFERPELLEEAFRHSSYVNEYENVVLRNNERLEFLGDAVLDLAISHILMELFEDAREGDLSKYRATVVNETRLYKVARDLKLGEYLLLGKGEEMSQGREKPSILADTMEALLGALYLDAGFVRTKEIIHKLFLPLLSKIDPDKGINDFKSLLQEHTQEVYKARPDYAVIKEWGPPHDKTFTVALRLCGRVVAEGEGKSKKEAEQKAAREAFLCLTQDQENH